MKQLPITLFLIVITLVSAFAVDYVQHENRRYFALWQKEITQRDALNTEWGRLQIELGAHTMHNIIEQKATSELQMAVPKISEIYFVTATEESDRLK